METVTLTDLGFVREAVTKPADSMGVIASSKKDYGKICKLENTVAAMKRRS